MPGQRGRHRGFMIGATSRAPAALNRIRGDDGGTTDHDIFHNSGADNALTGKVRATIGAGGTGGDLFGLIDMGWARSARARMTRRMATRFRGRVGGARSARLERRAFEGGHFLLSREVCVLDSIQEVVGRDQLGLKLHPLIQQLLHQRLQVLDACMRDGQFLPQRGISHGVSPVGWGVWLCCESGMHAGKDSAGVLDHREISANNSLAWRVAHKAKVLPSGNLNLSAMPLTVNLSSRNAKHPGGTAWKNTIREGCSPIKIGKDIAAPRPLAPKFLHCGLAHPLDELR